MICGTHWPIVSPSPAYSIVGKGNTFLNGEAFAKDLADLGVRLFFSGHTHIQCIKKITSDTIKETAPVKIRAVLKILFEYFSLKAISLDSVLFIPKEAMLAPKAYTDKTR